MKFLKLIKFIQGLTKIVVLPISLLIMAISLIWGVGGTMFTISFFMVLGALGILSLWFVPSGFAGVKQVMGKLVNQSFKDGIHFIIPFVTDTHLMDLREIISVPITDTMKVLTRNDLTITYIVTFTIRPEYAHIMWLKLGGQGYFATHVSHWVDGAINTLVSKLIYAQFQTQKGEIEEIISKVVAVELDKQSSAATKEYGHHDRECYDIDMSEKKFYDINNNGQLIEVPVIKLIETKVYMVEKEVPDPADPSKTIKKWVDEEQLWKENVEGINFFDYVKITIKEVKFEKEFEEAQRKLVVEQTRKATATVAAERQAIEAEGDAKATRIRGEGQAAADKAIGDVWDNSPGLTRRSATEHMPKVVGGNNIIDINKLLEDGN